jgi:hypothetical protein
MCPCNSVVNTGMPVDHDMRDVASMVGVAICWQETEDRVRVNGIELEEQHVYETRDEHERKESGTTRSTRSAAQRSGAQGQNRRCLCESHSMLCDWGVQGR